MKKYWCIFGLWGALLIMIGIRHITIPLYNHFLKPKPIEWKWTEVPPKAYTYVPELPKHKGISKTLYGNCVDTLYGGDTIYIYPIKKEVCGTLEFEVTVDSLSGATNGKIYIQESKLGLVWEQEAYSRLEKKEVRINGVHTQTSYSNLRCSAKIRLMAVAYPNTQKNIIRFRYSYNYLH